MIESVLCNSVYMVEVRGIEPLSRTHFASLHTAILLFIDHYALSLGFLHRHAQHVLIVHDMELITIYAVQA